MAGSRIQLQVNGRSIEGYLSPAASGSGPGVVVIQEWWGLVPHVEDICDRLAAEGFTALAPDLYHGTSTKSPDDAGKLMMALRIDEAEADLRSAIEHLVAHDAVKGQKVGTVGFCMGGKLSLYAAASNPAVGACIDFYGIHPNVNPPYETLQAPVLGFFGGQDPMVTPEDARSLESTLKSLNKPVAVHIYDDAGHAFFNDTRPDAYNEAAAKDAWAKMLQFYRSNLG